MVIFSSLDIIDDKTTMLPPPLLLHSQQNFSSETIAMGNLKRLSLTSPTKASNGPVRTHRTLSSPKLEGHLALFVGGQYTRASSFPTEPNAFLTALATQERRVLEMREDLQKAELDLERLKEQWAKHEATKKKDEMRHITQLRPIVSPKRRETFEPDGYLLHSSRDQGCQEALHLRTRQTQRKVFSGSKHTRTLSLLSQASPSYYKEKLPLYGGSFEQQKDRKIIAPLKIESITNIAPSVTTQIQLSTATQYARGFPKEDLVNTGKQLVGDLREDLWTFIDDLRQAAVGEEALSGTRLRHSCDGRLATSPSGQSSRRKA